MLFSSFSIPGPCREGLGPILITGRAGKSTVGALGLAMLLSGCSGVSWVTTQPAPAENLQPVPNVSPHFVAPLQGVAMDPSGTHYLSFTASISAYDENWKRLWFNDQPFAAIDAEVNHMGDIEYSNGLIYAPVESFRNCNEYSSGSIAVYDAASGALVNWVDISGDEHEASAVAVATANGQVVVSSFCQPNALWVYDLNEVNTAPMGSAVTAEGAIRLSQPVIEIQGISWNPYAGEFLMSSDRGRTAGLLWLVSPSGTVTGPVYRVPQNEGDELEGVDASVGNAYYAERGNVYGVAMPVSAGTKNDSAGIRPQ